ncbi:hypothetical protein EES41_37460 (plasmid) [Streptomyces sp. ADI95-16]|uniref:hypothetical protein n=1 Tax=Streptomyces sp. ADI95-16 TaxID=1522758 RepID=UPI000F42FC13|nr:hypothetical protein [Streptomyces sp. ADI95-16]AYV32453.1 hypothetical protein EES41_37460 [Streptomyces sp. ADI95-16]
MHDDTRSHVHAGAMPRRSALTWSKTMLRDLAAWLARKPVALSGARRSIPHSADARTIIWAVTAADLVTSVVVDAMVPPAYRPLHLVWVVLSLVMTVGFCAMTMRTPHLIDDDTLYLRTGPFRALVIPINQIQTVRAAHGMAQSHGLRRLLDQDDAVACSVSSATTMALELTEPLPVQLRKGEPIMARRVYFTADQPAAAAELIRRAMHGDTQP